jgi:hypothetical protein
MVTNRTPIHRRHGLSITHRAIALFDQYRYCHDDKRRWDLHSQLIDELANIPPWQWPCIRQPDDPEDPQTDAERLWLQLAQASREARRARRRLRGTSVQPPPPPEQPPPAAA